jgi:hypothetical protein
MAENLEPADDAAARATRKMMQGLGWKAPMLPDGF